MTEAERTPATPGTGALEQEVEDLRAQVRELRETLDAIRSGEVDAIVVSKGETSRVYALEGADHPYRALVENIQEGALTVTTEGLILYANAAFAAMRGLPVSAILGTSLADHLASRDRATVDALLDPSRTGAGRGEMSVRSGTATIPVQVSMTPLVVNDETKISVVVTDRRQDYGRLRLQGRMLDSVADAVTAVDPGGTIIYWNRAAERLYGWTAEEMVRRPMADATWLGVTEAEARLAVAELRAGLAWSGESVARHRDGRSIPVLATRAPVYDEDGTLIAIIGTSHDIGERKRVEEELRQSREQFRIMGETLPYGVWRCNARGGAEYVSQSFLNLLEMTEDEMREFGWTHRLPPEDVEPMLKRWLHCVETGTNWDDEHRVLGPDGVYHTVLTRGQPVRDKDGEIVAWVGINLDIDERKKAEEALAESEERFRALYENSRDAIILTDPVGGRILSANPAACRMLGWAEEDLVGQGRDAMFDPADRRVAALVQERGRTGAASAELVYRRRDGSTFPGEVTTALFTDSRGDVCSVAIIRDVTERKRFVHALAESEEKYRSLVDLSPDAVVVHRRGIILYANPAAARLLRGEPGVLVGTDILDLVHPDDRAVSAGRIAAVQDRGEATPLREFRLLIDGAVIDAEAVGGPVRWEGAPAVQVVIRDVSERKRAEEALRASNEELQRFAYVASHDLQEPLRSIVSFSQLLERRYRGRLDADADDYIAFIVEGGIRMQSLIRDLLQVSRVETAAKPLAPTDAGEVVADVLRLLETPIGETGATVTIGPMPRVMADAAQLEQVFVNLISNALKYRREDVPPAIAVSARRLWGMEEFSVADNGIGIEKEYYDRIFEMFRRLHTHDEYEGTGIGLAVVKKIVERHGGRVRVESTPGEGSTFSFTLPAA